MGVQFRVGMTKKWGLLQLSRSGLIKKEGSFICRVAAYLNHALAAERIKKAAPAEG